MIKNEILSKSILENSPDCIKIIDNEGKIKFMNEQGLCLLEFKGFAQVENKYWWDLWDQDDQPLIKNAITKALVKEKVHFQASSKTAEGNLKWWDVIVLPMENNSATNEVKQLLTVSRDITDYKNANLKILESEQHFRQLADIVPAKISNADKDGNVIYLNKNWLDYTGKSFDELKARGYHSIMHPDEIENFTSKFLIAAETRSVLQMEMRFLDKFGEYKWHLNLASPIIDKDGEITMWVGSTTEIHDQIQQKELLEMAVTERTIELEIANKKLIYQNIEKEKRSAELCIANNELAFQNGEKEKRSAELLVLNKELQSFTYVASQDLQEPLRKIKFFTHRIVETELDNLSDTSKDYFKRIFSASQRMGQLIEDLLSFSRVNIGEREMVLTDITSIISEVEEELKESIENKHVIIEIKNTCSVKLIVFQFRQLLHNLLGNSIKFSQADVAPNITISSHIAFGKELPNEQLIPTKQYCHIFIKDNGIGFEPEYSNRIFEVFQKLHSKEVYKGTGIGLAIVKKIVDNHNGIITATGVLGGGATFDIYLPA